MYRNNYLVEYAPNYLWGWGWWCIFCIFNISLILKFCVMWEAGLHSLLPHAGGQSPSWEVRGRGQQGLGVCGLHGVCLSRHHRLCEWKSRTWGEQLWDGQLAAQDWGSFPSTCPGRPRTKATCVRRLPHLEGILQSIKLGPCNLFIQGPITLWHRNYYLYLTSEKIRAQSG